jgi:hypothetical protein
VLLLDADALFSFAPGVFDEWLGTSIARTIDEAPDRWMPVRAVRGKVSLHVELLRVTPDPAATLWIATRPGAPLAVEWRLRRYPRDASRGRLHFGLEAVEGQLRSIASDARELCNDIGDRKQGPKHLMPPLHRIDVEAEDLARMVHLTTDAVKGWDAKLAEPTWPSAVDFDVNAPALPADLVAALPGQRLYFERFLARFPKRRSFLGDMPGIRFGRWRNTGIRTEAAFFVPGGGGIGFGTGEAAAQRYREGRKYASHAEATVEALDVIRTKARDALFETEDMLESIDEVDPGGASKKWRARAFRALRETMPVLALWAYEGSDELLACESG